MDSGQLVHKCKSTWSGIVKRARTVTVTGNRPAAITWNVSGQTVRVGYTVIHKT